MNVNFAKIKLGYLFIGLVIQTYTMYNMYECLLYVEPILNYGGTKIYLTFN